MTNAVTPTVAVRHPSEVQAALTFEQVSDPDTSALAHPHTGRAAEAGGGSALLTVQSGGKPFVDWATVLRRTAQRIRDRYEPLFPHVHPHVTRHTFALATLERLVRGHYQQARATARSTGSPTWCSAISPLRRRAAYTELDEIERILESVSRIAKA